MTADPNTLRRFAIRLLMLCLGVCLSPAALSSTALAQAPAPVATPGPTPAGSDSPRPNEPSASGRMIGPQPVIDFSQLELLYLPNSSGQLVAVPAGGTLDGFLAYLRNQSQDASLQPPSVSVTRLDLNGSVDGDRLRLKVAIRLQVNRTTGWVRVPLQLAEATLDDVQYVGSGEAVPDGLDPLRGLSWMLKGAGAHQLNLDCTVPVRRLGTSSRVQLSLPNTVVSALTLEIPEASISARAGERTTVAVQQKDGKSILTASGLGPRLDLSWQPLAEPVRAESGLEVASNILVTIADGENSAWEITQRIIPLQGSLSEVRMRLPMGLEPLRSESPDLLSTDPDPNAPGWLIARFRKPVSSPVELRWTLRGKLSGVPAQVIIEGLEVDKARIQTGFLAVSVVGDYQLSRELSDSRLVQRINVSDLPAPLRPSRLAAAYRILGPAFRFSAQLTRIEPLLASSLSANWHFGQQQTDLELRGRVEIRRGQLNELKLNWPDVMTDGWFITSSSTNVTAELVPAAEGRTPFLQVRLSEPAREQVEFTVSLRSPARAADVDTPIRLPEMPSDRPVITNLSLTADDPLELRPAAGNDAAWENLTQSGGAATVEPGMTRGLAQQRWRNVGLPRPLMMRIKPQTPELSSDALVLAQLTDEGRLSIQQRLQLNIRYTRLRRLTFLPLTDLDPQSVRILGPDSQELKIQVRENDAKTVLWDVQFPTPLTGDPVLEVRFRLTDRLFQRMTEQGELDVPWLRLQSVPCRALRFRWSARGGEEIRIRDEGWERDESGSDQQIVWKNLSAPAQIPLSVNWSDGVHWRNFDLSRAYLQSAVELSGTVRTIARWNIHGPLSLLPVDLPANAQLEAVWWNRQQILDRNPLPLSDGRQRIFLTIPIESGVRAENLLTIEYREAESDPLRLMDRKTITPPRLPLHLSQGRTVWDLILPEAQHLLSSPGPIAAQFEWQFQQFLWGRVPLSSQQELLDWVAQDAGQTIETAPSVGHRYQFTTKGPLPTLTVSSMSRSLLVLMGAGAALILGFVLVQVRFTRSVFTFLLMASVLAALGLWYPEPVAVLLQPAILGVGLALVAAWVDGFIHRRRMRGVITVAPAGEASGSGERVNLPLPGYIGSEDFTAIRVPIPQPADPIQPVQSGAQP